MIKNLKSKFLICLFLLVTVFSVASSCFASTTIVESPYSVQDFLDSGKFNSEIYSYDSSKLKYVGFFDSTDNTYWLVAIHDPNDSLAYIKQYNNGTLERRYFRMYDKNNNEISLTYSQVYVNSGVFYLVYSSIRNESTFIGKGDSSRNPIFTNLTTVKALALNGSVLFDYEAPISTDFNYLITGVKRGQTKLIIDNLDSSLKMYGYIGLEESFEAGETLDVSANTDFLRLLTYDSETYCYLNEGEEVNYYIVDENNVILDTGYISDMAKGDFLYGFNVNNGVDFVFLRDGQVYWDNNLIFKYSLKDSSLIQNNAIVSMGVSSYIETNKTIASNTYTGYVYDLDGSVLSQADVAFSNDLSSISIFVDTNYYETSVGYNKGVFSLQTVYLNGTNIDGSNIDFSNYSVIWSIPSWLDVDSINVNYEEYSKRSGTLSGFSSNGVLSCFIDFYLLISNLNNKYIPFDITLQVYDDSGSLVLTHVINSDDIAAKKISSEENNVTKEDYEILDNPNYTGGSSNSSNMNNIQDWTIDDYKKLMSTDNFVWEFFKSILGNLPWWITTPLTILIFGVVIITLIRFARGA